MMSLLAGLHLCGADDDVPAPGRQSLKQGTAVQFGPASWYGFPFHGRMAASGEIYDMEQFTAAHRTLPFGTRVRVRRLDTNQTVIVRINDRGPFVGERVIDLSLAAARHIDMVRPGVIPVGLEILNPLTADPSGRFAVQIGAFRIPENAELARAVMQSRYGIARIVVRHREEDLLAVLVGEVDTLAAAASLARTIRLNEPGSKAFVVRVDPQPAAITAE